MRFLGIGSIYGTAATVIGIGAAVVGLFAAGIVAAKPEQSYATDLAQKCQTERPRRQTCGRVRFSC